MYMRSCRSLGQLAPSPKDTEELQSDKSGNVP